MTKSKSYKKKKADVAANTTPSATPPTKDSAIDTPINVANGLQRNGIKTSLPWEREFIGTFLLKMCDDHVISAQNNWYVDKTNLRIIFQSYLNSAPQSDELRVKLGANGPSNIGSLLHRTNFLINTPRGDMHFRIKSFALMDFRKEKYNEIDKCRQADALISDDTGSASTLEDRDKSIMEEHKLDESAEPVQLMYQKTHLQQQDINFELDSLGCYICQCNFDGIEKFEEHIEYHGDESDFQSLQNMQKFAKPMLKLSYQSCVDSHFFGFTLESELPGIVIEKFIIVQLRQFYYVYNGRMPLKVPEDGRLRFFVDSHVFMILREQPIVIGYSRRLGGETQHFVEQHHFMRTEALPKPAFAVNPYRLSSAKLFQAKGKLTSAKPPTNVVKALKQEDVQKELGNINSDYRSYLQNGRKLTYENMQGTLRMLLHVEDIECLQHYVALKQINMELHQFGKELSVKMKPNPRNISPEDVLSPYDDVLIINERVTASQAGSIRSVLDNSNLVLDLVLKDYEHVKQWARTLDERFGVLDKSKHEPRVYFARVLGVSSQRVNITCERHLPVNTRYTLIFRPLRSVIRYQYRALQLLSELSQKDVRRMLYPEVGRSEGNVDRSSMLQLANSDIANNPEQLQAVYQIANCKQLAAPYIIVGPPGTGKTATICEAIYQLYMRRPETRILVLAGSNTACDEIALRLLRCISKQSQACNRPLTRIFSATCDRRIDNIDDLLLEYSNMYKLHFYPHVQAVHEYRIVVCTLSLAGKLSTGGLARHDDNSTVFTHVFVDEAAASTEAEVLMGIACTIGPYTNLVLSGDHKQLGPVLQSQRASEWGLSLSLLERLLQRDCYQLNEQGTYNASLQTRLLRNFRSHPQIVSLFNDLYYESALMAEAPLENVSLGKDWFHTTNASFPIMFHSVFGTVMTTKSSSVSLCNNKEIDAVMDYVKDLMYFGINGQKLLQTDIGIISPYKSQYQRIQEQLNMRNWQQIECGSVELFQGKEKQIIIVSFVRSFTPKLGFLDNTRRLNVLLSRPMSLLILIGNPRTLSQNKDFRYIIDKCRTEKTLVGSPYYHEDNDNELNVNGHRLMQKRAEKVADNASGLKQSFKRTTARHVTTAAQTKKLHYTKKELIELKATVGPESKKSAIDQLFDELPSVPRNLYSDEEYERQNKKEQELIAEKWLTFNITNPASSKGPTTGNSTSANGSSNRNSSTTTATSSGAGNKHTTAQMEQGHTRLISSPSASRTTNEGIYSTQYRYVPNGSSRFESRRPLTNHSSSYNFSYTGQTHTRSSSSAAGDKKKKDCVIL